MKRKKQIYLPSWSIALIALLLSCLIAGICCYFIYRPKNSLSERTSLMQHTNGRQKMASAMAGKYKAPDYEEKGSPSKAASREEDGKMHRWQTPSAVLPGDNDEIWRYKIETIEATNNHISHTVYVRLCQRDIFTGNWVVIEERGDPYFGMTTGIENETSGGDVLSDVNFVPVDGGSIPEGSRGGYSWYGNSYFKAREEWLFFSGGRLRDSAEIP